MLTDTGEGIYLFDCRPGLRFRSPLRLFLPLIKRARRSITMSMAYFLPGRRLLRALQQARRRGVEVTVIVPAQSDVRLVQWATRHLYIRLLRHGIQLYERQDQMLHSKAMVVDGRTTVVGSCNLDPRSLWLNLEFLGVIHAPQLASAVERICAFEIENSKRVTLEDYHGRRWWQRLLDRAAFALRRWL
jgi:cardiolipin synthase